MKFLFIPANNSLSHPAKCLAVMSRLQADGHEVHLAASKRLAPFLDNYKIKYHLLPDIQETDHGGFPSFEWFSNPEIIGHCINEEVALIKKLKPDKIIGVFRFTCHASAQIAKVPYYSLICGCMLPDSPATLGFSDNDPGRESQKQFLENFYKFAAKKFSLALTEFGLPKIDDIRFTLKGEHTFLWDFPEFMPLPPHPTLTHIGPISFNRWPYDPVDPERLRDSNNPIAVVAFGTCVSNNDLVIRIVRLLLDLNFKVIVAAGGQQALLDIRRSVPRATVLNYAPLSKIFPATALLVTHGGQMTIFEALQHQIPVLVMPLQPEQAHNGVCLEAIYCGARLIPSAIFSGISEDYLKVIKQTSDETIKRKILDLTANGQTKICLKNIKTALARYHGVKTLVNFLKET